MVQGMQEIDVATLSTEDLSRYCTRIHSLNRLDMIYLNSKSK